MLKHILQVMSGNGVAQIIQFSALFVLLKLYSPREFSELAIAQSIATFIAVFFTLQLNHTIPIIKQVRERSLMYSYISMQIGTLMMILSCSVILVVGYDEIFLGVVLGLLLALYNLNLSYLGAKQEFGLISKTAVFRAFAIVVLQYLFSHLDIQHAIVLAVVLAEFLTQLMFFRTYTHFVRNITKLRRYCKVIIRRYKDFYVYGTCSEITAILAFTFPLYFIDYKFGDDVSGNYGMAYRLVWGPIVLLTSSVCQVAYTKMGTLEKQQVASYLGKFKLTYIALLLISLASALCLIKPILEMIFSGEWLLTADLIPLLTLWGAIYISISIFRLSFRVFHRQRYLFYIDLSYLAVLALFSLFFKWDIYIYIMGVLILYAIFTLLTMLYIKVYIRKYYA